MKLFGIGLERNRGQSLPVPRQPTKGTLGSPSNVTSTGGGSASVDRLYEIYERLTSIESSVAFLVAAVDDSKKKIDEVTRDVAEAKATFNAFQPILKGIGRALWAMVAGVTVFVLGLLTMWIKHKMGW